MPETVALVVAAGRGSRMSGDTPKQYRSLRGRAVLRHALEAFAAHRSIDRIFPVIHGDDEAAFAQASQGLALEGHVIGGTTRQESVLRGLEVLAAGRAPERVLIHDGARPFVSAGLIDRVLGALDGFPGAVPALDVTDTVKRVDRNRVAETVDRCSLVRVQTPQGFRFDDLLSAHRAAAGQALTDDAAISEAAGLAVVTVPGEESNIKVTHDDDLARAAAWLDARCETRVGSGFDVHAFGPGDHVRLCGIDIPHDQSLAGLSDADVGLHAITDAILGALGDGDIGSHFPPSEERWRGADSAQFLQHAMSRLAARRGYLVHTDVTIICQAPRVGPHRDAMRARVAEILAVDVSRVSVKATTTEQLGFTGRGEGIAAQATATIALDIGE